MKYSIFFNCSHFCATGFLLSRYGQCESRWKLQNSCCTFTSFIKSLTTMQTNVFGEVTLRRSQDKYSVHTAIWDVLEELNHGHTTFMHLLHLDFVSGFFQSGTNPALQSAACRPLLLIQSRTVS